MRPDDTVEYSGLNWVKKELDAVLNQARLALEAYIEDSAQVEQLDECSAHLKQVHGTLQMVELYGAAMLTEELQAVVQALREGAVNNREDAFEVVMRAMLQLPDYLEHVQTGHRDIPIVLLPLLNDLRATRDAGLLSEHVLFFPDLSAAPKIGAKEAASAENAQGLAKKLRHPFQLALLGWMRDRDVRANHMKLLAVASRLGKACQPGLTRNFWWIVAAVLEAMALGGLKSSATLKQLIGQIERLMKVMVSEDEEQFAQAIPVDLTRNLLYFVATAAPKGEHVLAVKRAYKLDKLLPAGADLEEARGSLLGGANLELLNTVAKAIREDLAEVKDSLELFVHAANRDVADLQPLVEKLRRIADTIGMLGLAEPRELVQQQAGVITAMAGGERPADDTALLDVAGTMLKVESLIGDFVSGRAGGGADLAEVQASAKALQRENLALPESEYKEIVAAAIREILTDMSRAKEAIIDYVASPEDPSRLAETPAYLARIRGALAVLPLERLTPVLDSVRRYIAEQILTKGQTPGPRDLEALADAITSVEFYLESLANDRGEYTQIIEVGKASVAKLGYPADGAPPAEIEEIELEHAEARGSAEALAMGETAETELAAPMPTVETAEGLGPTLEAPLVGAGTPEGLEPTLEAPLPAFEAADELPGAELETAAAQGEAAEDSPSTAQALRPSTPQGVAPEETTAAPARAQETALATAPPAVKERPPLVPLAGEVDAEILEIFLEEAGEEAERIREYLPKWEANLEDQESLVTVRRSFHTLKGSGRLVGAQLLGEFAWAFESLLNRVIDKTIEPAPHIFQALGSAVEALPELITQIRGEGEPRMDVLALMDLAEAMAKPGYAESLGVASAPEESEADRTAFVESEPSVPEAEPELPPAVAESEAAPQVEELFAAAAAGEAAAFEDLPLPALEEIELEPMPEMLEAESVEIDLEAPVPEARLDPVLYSIFKSEAEQHLETVQQYLAQDLEGREGLPVVKELIRALHTLNGSARTADVPEISRVFTALENYAKSREDEALVLPRQALNLMQQALEHTHAVLASLGEPGADVPTGADLLAQIERFVSEDLLHSRMQADARAMESAPAAPASAPAIVEPGEPDMPGEQDMELVDIFLEEAVEIMDATDGTLTRLEANTSDQEAVTEFQRQLHTLKGGARMAGFKNIGNLSHAVESLMIGVTEGQVVASPAMFQQLHAAMDRLSGMLDDARNGQPIQPAPDLIAALEALRLGQMPPPALAPTVAQPVEAALEEPLPDEPAVPEPLAPVQPDEGLAEEPVQAAEPVREEAPVTEVAPPSEARAEVVELERAREERAAGEARTTARTAPQELVRVRADLLDNLVNYAGEVNIYHSRLEQQITGFRFNLQELGQTVRRLREQLRKLELETEAQIRSGYEKQHGHESGFSDEFDPLELDQYSNIQQLSRALAESLNDLVSIEEFLAEQVRDTETLLLQQSRVSTDLQEGLMRTRMVQFTGMVPRLRRIVRQTAQELGKKVELDIVGETSELDRSVLERMIAPLEHMLRNAIAHGIEEPMARRSRGKPEEGHVRIEIGREASEVVIRVTDDGGGIDIAAVRAKAKKMGLGRDVDTLSDSEAMQLILESGFSTAKQVSQIAGRGVGMDVVANEIKQLNGVLNIDSSAGRGTTFTVRLPFTLAINQALLVQSGEDIFAIPLSSIEGIVRASSADLRVKLASESPSIEYAANRYELRHLGTLLGIGQPQLDQSPLYPVLLVRSGDQRIALQVEGLLGSREVVVKSVGPQISKARGISGATILGDGRVVLILDVPALVRMGIGLRLAYSAEAAVEEAAEGEEKRQLTVMVVDDSITIRKVTARMLERNDFAVITAKDGVDAVAQLQDQVPDLMLLDIEMPRMDGYELAQHVRNDARLREVPIIMITSRTGEKHRQRALDIGVNRYLGKPYQEADLLENIQQLLQETGKL